MKHKNKKYYISLIILFFIISFSISSVVFADVISTTLTIVQVSDIYKVSIHAVAPEGRPGGPGTNDDIDFNLSIRTAGISNDDIFDTVITQSTDSAGQMSTTTVLDISAGTYDVGIKGAGYLTRVLRSVPFISSTTTTLNFTDANYASLDRGNVLLLVGDINGVTTVDLVLGDDNVNSIDLSILVDAIDDEDSGNTMITNFNRDNITNSVDLSLILNNLDKVGDK